MIGINVQGLIDWLTKIGFGGLLIFILAGFQQGWWVFGREAAEWKAERSALIKDRDEWKALALNSMHAAERTVAVAQSALPRPEISAS